MDAARPATAVAILLTALGRPSQASFTMADAALAAGVTECYWCSWENCSASGEKHFDMDGSDYSDGGHANCAWARCDEHDNDCSETFSAPEEGELAKALEDETGVGIAKLVTTYRQAAHVELEREALQVIGCSGYVMEHHPLSARQIAAVERLAAPGVALGRQ